MPKGFRADGTPIRPPGRKVPTAIFKSQLLARARGATPQESESVFVDDDTRALSAAGTPVPARVARSGYGTLPVYVLTADGCRRIHVAVQSINEVLSQPHYSATCFDCGSNECNGEINGCPGRPARKYRTCPVPSCSKVIFDTVPTGEFRSDEFDHTEREASQEGDVNRIRDNEYSAATPETRTKAKMDLHIISVHPATAMELNLGRPAELPRMTVTA